MNELTPMQHRRFSKGLRANHLDNVRQITPSEFYEGVKNGTYKQLKTFTTPDNLHFDEEKGGIFVWSQNCQQYFLIGQKII